VKTWEQWFGCEFLPPGVDTYTTRGDSDKPLLPGFHIKNPWIDDVIIVDTKLGEFTMTSSCASKDIQQVVTEVSLQYRLDDVSVPQMYSKIGTREHIQKTILGPAVLESTKAVTANFTAEELVTKRSMVKIGIRDQLTSFITKSLDIEGCQSSILIQNIAIKDFAFSESYNDAIETKVKAEQAALQAKNEKEKIITAAEGWAQTVRIQANATAYKITASAEAQAHAILQQAEALKDSGNLLQLRLAERWNGQLPHVNFAKDIPLLGHIMNNGTESSR
jgi:regulator of protease activity HflC (stomatin/prohibitin superfamily)